MKKNSKGQTLVETAIILPVLFLLVIGIFEFGRALYIISTLNNAARAGVRVAVVSPPGSISVSGASQALNSSCTFSGNNSAVLATVCNSITMGIPDKTVVTARLEDLTNGNTNPPSSGDTLRLTVAWGGFATLTNYVHVGNALNGIASMRYE